MAQEKEEVEILGRFLMEYLRDRAIQHFEDVLRGRFQPSLTLSPPDYLLKQQSVLATLSTEQQEMVRQCVYHAVDGAIHDFLFQFEEIANFGVDMAGEHKIQILVDGIDLAGATDGLQGFPYGDDGWRKKYSKWKSYDYLITDSIDK